MGGRLEHCRSIDEMHHNNRIARILQRSNGLVLSLTAWDKESSLFGLIDIHVPVAVNRAG